MSVGNTTDRKKADLFNSIEDLIKKGYIQDAIDHLEYLYRTTPSIKQTILLKFAKLYTQIAQPEKALLYLQKIIPTSDLQTNELIFENLIKLDKEHQAIMFIARSDLSINQKTILLKNNGLLKEPSVLIQPVILQCLKCNSFLFFLNNKLTCLTCRC